MTNAELIEALRWCSIEDNEYCVDDDYQCPYFVWDKSKDDCKSEMMNAAADALEAAEKQIAKQQKQIANLYILLNNRINKIEELEAQIKMDGKEQRD